MGDFVDEGCPPKAGGCYRHTFASHLAMRGASMKAIQELLGHSTMKMTLRYAHLTPTVRRDTVELLAAAPPRYIRGTRSGKK